MTNDELISAYVDGQLSEREQAAFEARLRSDDALQRGTDVTRFAIRSAQQLPGVALPRNFSLPASMAQPERASFGWRLWSRVGSAFAAVVFVALVALDLSRGLSHPEIETGPIATPAIAPAVAPAPQTGLLPTLLVTQAQAKALSAPTLAGTQLNVIETMQLTEPSSGPQIASADGAESVVAVPQARATKSLNSLSKLAPTLAATLVPMATTLQATIALTPIPTASAMSSDANQSMATWPRLFAGLMLMLGVLLAFLGWRR